MKKTIACMLAAAVGFASLQALDVPPLTLASTIGFNTEYVNHGRKEGHQNVQMSAEMGADVLNSHAYVGARSVLFLKDDAIDLGKRDENIRSNFPFSNRSISANEIAPYVGFTYDLQDCVTLDAGYVAHVYTNLKSLVNTKSATDTANTGIGPDGYVIARNTNELYIGARFDVTFLPEVYISYDFDREEFDINGAAVYSYDLGQVGIPHFAFECSAKAGYDYAKRPF
ncbi:MAG: hypothetical protein LBG86_01115, partial [Puniceicoccales bacterium]|nr:hypothetical protein [Puniceicoccales bacterium]